MSKFLGLDLSYSGTGFYVRGDDGTGIFSCEIKADKEYENDIYRVEKVADKIVEGAKEHKPDFIMLEDYFVGRQPGTVICLAVLGTMVRYKLLQAGFTFSTCTPSQLKKFVTGKGTGHKDIIIKAVYKRWNEDTNSNNIADACVLSHISEAVYKTKNNEAVTLFEYENEVVKKIIQERKIYVPKMCVNI